MILKHDLMHNNDAAKTTCSYEPRSYYAQYLLDGCILGHGVAHGSHDVIAHHHELQTTVDTRPTPPPPQSVSASGEQHPVQQPLLSFIMARRKRKAGQTGEGTALDQGTPGTPGTRYVTSSSPLSQRRRAYARTDRRTLPILCL